MLEACFHKHLFHLMYKRLCRDREASPRGALATLTTKQQRNLYFFFLRKEVIQPHLPIRLPCYDFTPVTVPAFGSSLPLLSTTRLSFDSRRILLSYIIELRSVITQSCSLGVGSLTSGIDNSHGVTGGVYKTRERIHRDILIRDY